MSRRRRVRKRKPDTFAARHGPAPEPVMTCLRCRLEYATPHAQDGKCICVYPIPSRNGRTPIRGVPTPQQTYQQIIADVARRGRS